MSKVCAMYDVVNDTLQTIESTWIELVCCACIKNAIVMCLSNQQNSHIVLPLLE